MNLNMTLPTIRLCTHDTNLLNTIQTKHINKSYDFVTKNLIISLVHDTLSNS